MLARQPRIVGFGITCLDYILVSPPVDQGGQANADSFTIQGGGLTGTSTATAARLGARVSILGRIGDDDVGDQIAYGLVAEGVDISGLIRVPGGKSLISVVIVDSRTAERTIYSRRDYDIDCSTDLIDLAKLEGSDAVLLDPHWAEGALLVAARAKELGIPIICDIRRPANHLDILALSDYPILSRASAASLLGRDDPPAALDLIRSHGPRSAVITSGSDGAYYGSEQESGHVPAFEVDAVDTTGAGDVFHGAFAFGLARGCGPRDVLVFASAAAALKCRSIGGQAGIPSFEQVMELVHQRC